MTEPAKKKAPTDWEAIERTYRAGKLSIREIAKEHGVSDTAIRKKATEREWSRDLTARVNEQARVALVRNAVRSANPEAEQEIVNDAADVIVTVVRSHRKRITRQTQLVDLLTAQLITAATDREDLEEAIEEETANDKSGERRARMMKAVSLSTHASTAVNLSNALKTLVGLERQAFNIKDESENRADALTGLLGALGGNVIGVSNPVTEE